MPTLNLEETITNAITDSELPLEDPEVPSDASDPEIPEEPTQVTEVTPEAPVEPVATSQVQSPAAKSPEAPKVDDFEKRFGIPQTSTTGRENRIPYSRVKKITAKAESEVEKRVRDEYTPKVTEFETKLKDYETKVTDYEGRLGKVAEFEKLLKDDPVTFLTQLVKLPQYQAYLAPLFEAATQPKPEAPKAEEVPADMPQPDYKLPDGTMTYSTEGWQKYNTWNRNQAATQARKDALAEVEGRFGPMYKEWEAHQRLQQELPRVQDQIKVARTWPQFNENEDAITEALQKDVTLSLEAAYNKVVVPKLVASRDQVTLDRATIAKEEREKVLAELKKIPRSTSTTTSTSKPSSQAPKGPRKIEDIIAESIESAGLK